MERCVVRREAISREADYEDAMRNLTEIEGFLDREAARLQEKILSLGGLEPGRIRRGFRT